MGSSGQIPLLIAAADGNVDLVKLLHENGADINIQVIMNVVYFKG